MALQIGTAYGHKDLLKKTHAMAQGAPIIGTVAYSGTGNGHLTMLAPDPAAPAETWTITCTTGGGDGVGVFSVSGSVSGAQADATVGVDYDSGEISFHITDEGVDFVAGDQWVFSLTTNPLVAAGQVWTIDRWDTSGDDHELLMHGPGLSGTDEIYCGIQTYQDSDNDYYNFRLNVFTGHVPGNDFNNQPGRRSTNYACPLWQFAIPYKLMISGMEIVCLAKVETAYQSFELGHDLIHGTPGQFPYPIGMSGMLTSDTPTRYSDTNNIMGIKRNNGHALRFVDGAYRYPKMWPFWNHQNTSQSLRNFKSYPLRECLGGEYPVIPIIMYDDEPNTYGELRNMFFIPGYANAVENSVVIGGDTYIVWRDHERIGFYDYFGVPLE